MIEMQVDFAKSDTLSAIENVISGPFHITHFSVDEDSARIPLSNTYIIDNICEMSGSFLWGEGCMFEIRSGDPEIFTIFAIAEDYLMISSLMATFAKLQVLFGYACDEAERVHRNRIVKKMDYGIHEAWVGRDYRKYLPGLYWMMLIPKDLLERHCGNSSVVENISSSMSLNDQRTWLICMYKNPSRWADVMDRVDNWCSYTAGCFNKKSVETAAAATRNFVELSSLFGEWP